MKLFAFGFFVKRFYFWQAFGFLFNHSFIIPAQLAKSFSKEIEVLREEAFFIHRGMNRD